MKTYLDEFIEFERRWRRALQSVEYSIDMNIITGHNFKLKLNCKFAELTLMFFGKEFHLDLSIDRDDEISVVEQSIRNSLSISANVARDHIKNLDYENIMPDLKLLSLIKHRNLRIKESRESITVYLQADSGGGNLQITDICGIKDVLLPYCTDFN
ncbi:MAG: hypothetical protein FWG69_04040 [Oscillospiraceae bacterium]|nr:hypothetical protein [Oscillospiraceae bacterium]